MQEKSAFFAQIIAKLSVLKIDNTTVAKPYMANIYAILTMEVRE